MMGVTCNACGYTWDMAKEIHLCPKQAEHGVNAAVEARLSAIEARLTALETQHKSPAGGEDA